MMENKLPVKKSPYFLLSSSGKSSEPTNIPGIPPSTSSISPKNRQINHRVFLPLSFLYDLNMAS